MEPRPVLLALLAAPMAALAYAPPSKFDNMNGAYRLSKTPRAPGEFPGTAFADFPGGVEYFEVYHGPITTRYSQVWWTSTSNPIPDDVVKRFANKTMAIVGLEMDQVRKTPQGDVRVPITMAYNHHHDTAVVGSGTHLEEVSRDAAMASHGREYIRLSHNRAWVPVEHAPAPDGVPTSAMFSDGNGGEYRKSYHAYAPPYVQLVHSPVALAGSPMQIDTWNREAMSITGAPHFVAGPLPAHSLAPAGAEYSGLLECPLTTRISKVADAGSESFNTTNAAAIFTCGNTSTPQRCAASVATAAACFAAAAALPRLANVTMATATVSDDTAPPGCSVALTSGRAVATYNSNDKSPACCGAAGGKLTGAAAPLAGLSVQLEIDGTTATITVAGPDGKWFGAGFGAAEMCSTRATRARPRPQATTAPSAPPRASGF